MLGTLRAVAGSPDLRRLQLAWAASNVAGWAYFVAIAVFAYDAGGATAVAVVTFIRLFAGGVAAPFLAVLADRYRRKAVMVGSDLVVATVLGAAAVVALVDASPLFVYALAVVADVAHSPFRPAQGALLPSLARTPEELTASNAVASTVESVGMFAGPALGGLLLAVGDPAAVLAATAGLFLVSLALVSRVHEDERMRRADPGGETVVRELGAGFAAIVGSSQLRLILGLYVAQILVGGVLAVLSVPLAVDILEMGEGGVGVLNAAIGLGGVLGGVAALATIGRRQASVFGAGLLLWGLPLVVLGAWTTEASALALLAVVGLANSLVDVAGATLLQRAVPDEVLARVFGVLESVAMASVAAGALLAALLVAGFGTRGGLAVSGALLVGLAVLGWPALRRIDATTPSPLVELELLRGVPFLTPLAQPALEALASQLEPLEVPAGHELVRQGEVADRFYVVASGELTVTVEGTAGPKLARGDFFGEIALLRDTARTATVTAATDSTLYALAGDDFVAAVTGYAESAVAADAVIATRLRALRPSLIAI